MFIHLNTYVLTLIYFFTIFLPHCVLITLLSLYMLCYFLTPVCDGFGGLVVSMLASGSRVLGFKPGRCKNPQHAFLRRGS
jgi:hypothetical protein